MTAQTAIFTNKNGETVEHKLNFATSLYQIWIDKNGNELRFDFEPEIPVTTFELNATYSTRMAGKFKCIKLTEKTITFEQDGCHIRRMIRQRQHHQDAWIGNHQIGSFAKIS